MSALDTQQSKSLAELIEARGDVLHRRQYTAANLSEMQARGMYPCRPIAPDEPVVMVSALEHLADAERKMRLAVELTPEAGLAQNDSAACVFALVQARALLDRAIDLYAR